MPRPKSSNPVRNISIGLPMTTHSRLEKFNPRNRSAFFNEAILAWMRQHDPVTKQLELEEYDRSADPYEAVKTLTDRQLAIILLARIPEGERAQLRKNLQAWGGF